jgi:hypothetical protein
MTAMLALATLLSTTGAELKPSPSDALALLFSNLDDKIPQWADCGKDSRGKGYRGRPVLQLLADWMGAPVPADTERKFSVECAVGHLFSGERSFVCTLFIERTRGDRFGGTLTFHVWPDGKRYVRNQVGCNQP